MVIIAALVTATAAVLGFLVNGSLNRATEKRRVCAEALVCVERYVQLPHTFARRANNKPETLQELGTLLAQVQIDMAFHKRWLQLEDSKAANAYVALCDKYEAKCALFRQQALTQPPVGVEVPRDHFKGYLAEGEWAQCLEEMRRHVQRPKLAFWRIERAL
ncbi:hypothetical protein [uncultured Modestobacter sp.]|uniref:hypothetical protein n=1 Tax=uncultured Modestobacter sp. TaxID=380048 RepID=UPI00261B18F3|nr:hypothetical protein [uncultured Modestobacter sp.]